MSLNYLTVRNLFFIVVATHFLSACFLFKKSSSNRSGPSAPAGVINIDPDDGSNVDLTMSQPVRGAIINTTDTSVTISNGALSVDTSLALMNSDCGAGSGDIYIVGGSKPYGSFTYADNKISIEKAPTSQDSVLVVNCAGGETIRCLAKGGDNGLLCNKTADAILSAFEIAIGANLTDKVFRGKSLARVVQSIVDATKLSDVNVEQFKQSIDSCALRIDGEKKSCYIEAIKVSPFYASFKLMQQMASAWTPEGLVTFSVDTLGGKIDVDDFIYTEMGSALDSALGTTFIADIKTLLVDAVNAQKAKSGKYAFQIQCSVDINGSSRKFEPDLNSGKVICSRDQAAEILNLAGISSSDINMILDSSEWADNINCTDRYASNGKCNISPPRAYIVSLNNEKDRNDDTGERFTRYQRSISMIDVMPQVMNNIAAEGVPVNNDGPNVNPNNAAEMAKFKTAIIKSKNYFLGLVGLYRFLNDPEFKEKKLSLNDINTIFTDERLINARLTAMGPSIGGRPIQSSNRYAQAILKLNPSSQFLTFDNIFEWNFSTFNQTITEAAYNNILANSKPSFSMSFDMFTKIPTAKEIEKFLLSSSIHTEWNPRGSKHLSVAQYQQSGKPILCQLNNSGPAMSYTENSTVSCASDYSDVNCDADGVCAIPKTKEKFLLADRGWYGDDKGRSFALISRLDGRDVGAGRGLMIKEYKAGNPAGACDSSQVGKVISYLEEFWCGPETKCQERLTAFCMDMSSLGTPARKRFYPSERLVLKNKDIMSGQEWSWEIPLIGIYDGNDHRNDYPACLKVPNTFFMNTTQAQLGSTLVTNTNNIDNTNEATNLSSGNGVSIVNCSAAISGGYVKYYMYQYNDFAPADSMYVYLLDAEKKQTLVVSYNQIVNGNWDQNNLRVTKSAIDSLLANITSGLTVAGSATSFINSTRFKNPAHDPKFDPYCDDRNGNGYCDCHALKDISSDGIPTFESSIRANPKECGLMDKAAEPTISEAPGCWTCQDSDKIRDFFTQFGGKGGGQLSTMQTFLDNQGGYLPMDMNRAVSCLYPDNNGVFRSPTQFDWGNWEQSTHSGCPAISNGTVGVSTTGPIRIINIKEMRNAYLIGKPNALLKMMNYATKSVGQGVTLDANAKLFSPDEVIAFLALRMELPVYQFPIVAPSGKTLSDAYAYFEGIENQYGHGDPLSKGIKGIQFINGYFTEAEISAVESH